MVPSDSSRVDLANWQIFLWALYQVGGDKGVVDIELAFVKAHSLAPGRFSWRTQKIADIKKLSKALRDAEAKAGSLLTKTSDGHKRQLTVAGIKWVDDNRKTLEKIGKANFGAGQARSARSTKWFIDIQNSGLFKAWEKDRAAEIRKWELAGLLQCSPDSPVETWLTRLDETAVAAHHANRDDIVQFLNEVREGLLSDDATS